MKEAMLLRAKLTFPTPPIPSIHSLSLAFSLSFALCLSLCLFYVCLFVNHVSDSLRGQKFFFFFCFFFRKMYRSSNTHYFHINISLFADVPFVKPPSFFSGRCTILILLNKSLLLGRCTIRQTPIFFLCIFICGRCTICHLYFSYASFF